MSGSVPVPSPVSVPDTDDVRRYARLGRKRLSVGWRRLALSVAPSPRPLSPGRAVADLPASPRLCVLCLGNVCRSPMAERYLRQRARQRGVDLAVESAGFIEEEGRSSPGYAVDAAAEFGVDLSDHRSRRITESGLERSDLVFLMDAYNYVLLDREFGDATDRAYFLRPLAEPDDGAYEVADPFRGDPAVYRRVYGEIAEALDALLDRLEADR